MLQLEHFFLMQEDDRTSSGGLDLEVEEARTSQVPKLDQLAPA